MRKSFVPLLVVFSTACGGQAGAEKTPECVSPDGSTAVVLDWSPRDSSSVTLRIREEGQDEVLRTLSQGSNNRLQFEMFVESQVAQACGVGLPAPDWDS